jgi:hypothetical protein
MGLFCKFGQVGSALRLLTASSGFNNFVNFCGQPGARLDVGQSLYGDSDTQPKNIFFRVMNIILFGSLDAHSKALHMIWVDHTIVRRRWKDFINGLNNEWNGYTIFVRRTFTSDYPCN